MNQKKTTVQEDVEKKAAAGKSGEDSSGSANGSWQKIEALRERAALKESLADVWDEDFDLDEEILAELDHTAEFFTSQDDAEEEIPDDDGEVDEFYEDEDV